MSAVLSSQWSEVKSFYEVELLTGEEASGAEKLADSLLLILQNQDALDTVTGEMPDIGPFDDIEGVIDQSSIEAFSKVRKRMNRGVHDKPPPARSHFQALQEWEGYVHSVTDSCFHARLLDLTADSYAEDEWAEFTYDDISDDDREMVSEGAIFRWSLGYQTNESGSRMKVSKIVFRRLPIWSNSDILEAKAKAATLFEKIQWD